MIAKYIPRFTLSSIQTIFLVALYLMCFNNLAFYSHLLEVYPLTLSHSGFLLTVVVGFYCFLALCFLILAQRFVLKPLLIFLLIGASSAAYFMDTYNVVIDESMLVNALETNANEAGDLMSIKMALYIFILGVVPSLFLYRAEITFRPFWKELWQRAKWALAILLLMAAMAFAFSNYYAAFFRTHKVVRYYFNPVGYVYGAIKLVQHHVASGTQEFINIAPDAKIAKTSTNRKLLVLVVGETARADHFSLNGYTRETTLLLKKENIINFPDFWSCGTATAISVPCMFSIYGEDGFNAQKVEHTENALDVLHRLGVNVLWRDNNSSSKGVADRVPEQDYLTPKNNPICDTECRDEGMLVGLQEYIDAQKKGDIVIVLHQMGNHGPAYYKRYPKQFEQFTPVCKTNELANCSKEEIINAYDNALLYTDYFLSKTIDLLKQNDENFETAMFYVSDHGESLGENGIYLHGMPNFIAPDAQRHVPAVLWLGSKADPKLAKTIQARQQQRHTQDSIFHTLLGYFGVETSVYKPALDIFRSSRQAPQQP